MNGTNGHWLIKFPENIEINKALQYGDRAKIAEKTGYRPGTIRDMLLGYRRIPDTVKNEITKLLKSREQSNTSLKQAVNQ